jgi:PAS domain S-box-containing protein
MSARAVVLVIDDDPAMCDALGAVLRAHGHTVETATRGVTGLAKARAQRFDVAIVDIRLPDVSGLELLEGLRGVSPSPEVVLVTGHGSLATALEAMRHDAFGYLLKPFEPDLLLATVDRALEKQRLLRALREAEEHHRLITEHIDDALFLLDPRGTLTYVSRSAEILTGYSEAELLSRPFTRLFEPDAAAEVVARLLAVGEAADAPARVDSRLVRKDGTPIWVEWNAASVAESGRAIGCLAVARDVTERKRAEEIARALADVGRELVGTLEPAEVARRIVAAVIRLFHGRRSALFQLEPASGELVVLASAGEGEPERWVGRRFPAGTTIAGRAVSEGRPVWSADVLAEYGRHLTAELRADLQDVALGAVLAVPLLARGRTLGALALGDVAGRRFGEEEGRLLAAFAGHAAIALENARLYAEADRRRREAEVLAELGRSLASSLDVATVLQRLAEAARELCRADVARIALREPGSDVMSFRHLIGTRSRAYGLMRVEPGKGAGGYVLDTGGSFRTADYGVDPRITGDFLDLTVREEGITAQLVVPIRGEARIEGLLYVENRMARPFTDQDEAVLARLADHAAVALKNAQLFADVRAARERLQALSRRLVDVQETERRHFARELHDEIGQGLTGLALTLEMSRRGRPEEARGHLADAQALVLELMARVRQLSLDLRPAMLDDLGLVPALQWLFERYTAQTGVAVAFRHTGVGRLPPDVETAVYRIVQEALTNVARHARVREVAVRLAATPERLQLEVEDRGAGFDADAAQTASATGGLLGMRERVSLLGGRLSLTSAPAHGTRLTADLPLAGPDAGAAGDAG